MTVLRNLAQVAFGIAVVLLAVVAMGWAFYLALTAIGVLANLGVLFGVAALVVLVAAVSWRRRRTSN
jgi:hypothetical protein